MKLKEQPSRDRPRRSDPAPSQREPGNTTNLRSAARVLALQQKIGNHAVGQVVAGELLARRLATQEYEFRSKLFGPYPGEGVAILDALHVYYTLTPKYYYGALHAEIVDRLIAACEKYKTVSKGYLDAPVEALQRDVENEKAVVTKVAELIGGVFDAGTDVDLSALAGLNGSDFAGILAATDKRWPSITSVKLPQGLILDDAQTRAVQMLFPNRGWIASKPGLSDDTLEQHMATEETWRQRQPLHSAITATTLAGVPAQQAHPQAIVLMGGPGAGKTSTLTSVLGANVARFVRVGPDDVKEHLPEYREAVSARAQNAANLAHAESAQLAANILETSIQSRRNLIYDGTGQVKSTYLTMILDLKARGYSVKLVMVHTKVDEAVKRTASRGAETGRFVPEKTVRDIHRAVPKNFAELAAEADEAELYDNSGRAPRRIWSKSGGAETIHDEHALGGFLDIANQDTLLMRPKAVRDERLRDEPQRLAALDADLLDPLALLAAPLPDPSPLRDDVEAVVGGLIATRKEATAKRKLPAPVALRSMPRLLKFLTFCMYSGLTRTDTTNALRLLATLDSADVARSYLMRYIAAGLEAERTGMLRQEGKLTFLHGTHSGTVVLVARTTFKLMPFGDILKLGIFPVSGELSAGIKSINATSISGMEMSAAGFKMTRGYATDPRYRFDLANARRNGNPDHVKALIAAAAKHAAVDTAIELEWDHARIAIYRRKLMDEEFSAEEQAALTELLEKQIVLWGAQEGPVAKAHIVYATDLLKTLRDDTVVPKLDKGERAVVELAFPVIFGSRSLKPTKRAEGVTGEVGIAGAAEYGTDVQIAFTEERYVPVLRQILTPRGVDVSTLDTAYFSFFSAQTPYPTD
jgi:predicted ABC-type ATPase